jgi:tetratricopeptide (TPR) repeat protein
MAPGADRHDEGKQRYCNSAQSQTVEQLEALGHDDQSNEVDLIGYFYRKLGDYKFAQIWYERALKPDPNHVLTWQRPVAH